MKYSAYLNPGISKHTMEVFCKFNKTDYTQSKPKIPLKSL